MPLSSRCSCGRDIEAEDGVLRRIGAKNVESLLSGVRARRIVIELSVAEENHLKPLIDQSPSCEPSLAFTSPQRPLFPLKLAAVGIARVSVPEISLPPFRSVIH